MKSTWVLLAVGMVFAVEPSSAQTPAGAPATQQATTASPADVLAAESLRHSAEDLMYGPDTVPARAARLVATARMAQRLNPLDDGTLSILAEIYNLEDDNKAVMDTLGAMLTVNPDDYLVGRRWLAMKILACHTADEREKFLVDILAQSRWNAAFKSDAAMQLASIYLGQGRKDEYARTLDDALAMDPGNAEAVISKLAATASPAPAQRAEAMLAILRSQPQAINNVWDLAALLDSQGLYDPSLQLFDYAEKLASNTQDKRILQNIQIQYFSAMLDAGQASQALEKFASMAKAFENNADFQSLLAEAYRTTGDQNRLTDTIQDMDSLYKTRQNSSAATPSLSLEQAWFHLSTKNQPRTAQTYVRQAEKLTGKEGSLDNNPLAQRVMGASQLLLGQPEEGEKRLRSILPADVYAAGYLAEYYFQSGKTDAAKKILMEGLSQTRSGPAFRRLRQIAQKNKLAVEPLSGADKIAVLFGKFDQSLLEIVARPKKYLTVTITPVANPVEVGEPLYLTITLHNNGPVDAPLGELGVIDPHFSISAYLEGEDRVRYDDLPLAVISAPKYLPPQAGISTRIRIDTCKLERTLTKRPFETLTVVIEAASTVTSSAAKDARANPFAIVIAPAKIVRRSLVPGTDASTTIEQWKIGYERELQRMMRDLDGDLPTRVRDARQIGAVASALEEARVGTSNVPVRLAQTARTASVIPLIEQAMQNRSPMVRAEMMASLESIPANPKILGLIAPSLGNRSALVRLRAAELLGLVDAVGSQPVLRQLAADRDELVRMVAKGFLLKTE